MDSFHDPQIESIGVIPSIFQRLEKYNMISYFYNWAATLCFPSYNSWKKLVNPKIHSFEINRWKTFCVGHPLCSLADTFFDNINPSKFWTLSHTYPDLVKSMHTQLRILGNFGFIGGVPWLSGTDGQFCFLCKSDIDDNLHFILDFFSFLGNFYLLFSKLVDMIKQCCNANVSTLTLNKISNLNHHGKSLFLVGFPFLVLKIYQLKLNCQ